MLTPKRKKPQYIVGIDEVGRGPLAGPVYVCAVGMEYSLYKKMQWKGLRDSKKLTATSRESWYKEATRLEAEGKISIGISSRSAASIDAKGINPCIRECIAAALKQLEYEPSRTLILLDGGLQAPENYPYQQTIIKGDDSQKIISIASVVAKVTRDAVMTKLHKKHSHYAWHENKGYGTRAHRLALGQFGLTDLHRRTYLRRILDK